MKMNKLLLFILAVSASHFLAVAEPINWRNPNAFDRQVLSLATFGFKHTQWVTPELLSPVIQRLKQMREEANASEPQYRYQIQHFDEALVALNDNETTLRMINEYHQNTGWGESVVESNGRGGVLIYLAEDIYTGSVEKRKGNSGLSIRDNSANIMLYIIWHDQTFPMLTRKWAKSLYNSYSSLEYERLDYDRENLPKLVQSLQQWWEHNKLAIEANELGSAAWIPPDYPLKSYENVIVKSFKNSTDEKAHAYAKEAAIRKDEEDKPKLESSKAPLLSHQAAVMPPILESPMTKERESHSVLWMTLMTTAVGVSLFFFKFMSKKRSN